MSNKPRNKPLPPIPKTKGSKKAKTTQKRRNRPRSNNKRSNTSQLSNAISGVLNSSGIDLSNGIGRGIGSALGGGLGSLIGKWTGLGDYNVQENSLMDKPLLPSNARTTTISMTEYIGDLVSSSVANTFLNANVYPINPLNQSLFPWLYKMAGNYQQYKMKGMLLRFKPLVGTAIASTTNPTVGGIVIATQYNATAPNFTTKQQMENHEFATSGVIYNEALHPIECKPSETTLEHLYVGASFNGDPRFNILGNIQVASYGVQGSSVVLGELWVSYEIEFYKPETSFNNDEAIWTMDAATTISDANQFNFMSPQKSLNNNMPTLFGNVITFPTGFWGYIRLTYAGQGWSSSTFGFTSLTPTTVFPFLTFPPIRTSNQISSATSSVSPTVVLATYQIAGGGQIRLDSLAPQSGPVSWTYLLLELITADS